MHGAECEVVDNEMVDGRLGLVMPKRTSASDTEGPGFGGAPPPPNPHNHWTTPPASADVRSLLPYFLEPHSREGSAN
eukprot:9212515-Alexandrium_andersonii.AAC.1